MMTPKELIKKQLDEYKRAQEKSDASYAAGQIPANTHDTHMANNTPLIDMYEYALKILNKYT